MEDVNKKIERLLQLSLHESDRLSNRTNWFLIFNATLFAVFAAISKNPYELSIIVIFALVVNYLWLMTSLYQQWSIKQIARWLNKIPEYFGNDLHAERRIKMPSYYRWANATNVFTFTLPILCLVVWFLVNLYSFNTLLYEKNYLQYEWLVQWQKSYPIFFEFVFLVILFVVITFAAYWYGVFTSKDLFLSVKRRLYDLFKCDKGDIVAFNKEIENDISNLVLELDRLKKKINDFY